MKRYLVSKDQRQLGPYTLDEVVASLRSKQIELMDTICEEGSDEWTLLAERTEILKSLKAERPVSPSAIVAPEAGPGSLEWYVLKGEHRFGPFAFKDVIRMLQEKVIFGFDFAWTSSLSGWKRVADIADFQESAIRHLLNQADLQDAFTERQHKRFPHGGLMIVHNQKSWWNAQGIEISAGGAGLIMENSMMSPGQQVFIHFKPFESYPAFNALGEIVSKKFREHVQKSSEPIEYGVRFLNLGAEMKARLGVGKAS